MSDEVYDVMPAQLRRLFDEEPAATPEAGEASAPVDATPAPRFGVMADMADGVEAVHQCLNFAGFTESPRAFVLALCDAAFKSDSDYVELYDAELAELQGCDERTVRRQRAKYMADSQRLRFSPVEVVEGKFDREQRKYLPTLYRLHLRRAVEQIVTQARASKGWDESDRRKQREAIRLAARKVYDSIPGAVTKRRKKRRPRPAVAEIATCRKLVDTTLKRLKKMAASLPEGERAQLTDAEAPGELYEWWVETRAEMDAFLGVNSPQTVEGSEDERDTGQVVRYPPLASEAAPEEAHMPSAEDVAAWEGLEERMTAPQVRRVEVELRPRGRASPLVDVQGAREGVP